MARIGEIRKNFSTPAPMQKTSLMRKVRCCTAFPYFQIFVLTRFDPQVGIPEIEITCPPEPVKVLPADPVKGIEEIIRCGMFPMPACHEGAGGFKKNFFPQ